MVLKQVDVPARQILVVIYLFIEHLSQVLVWLFILIFDKPLRELVHEVGSHAHNLSFVHLLLHFSVVSLSVILYVALGILVLSLHLDVLGRLGGRCPVSDFVLLLRVLVALLYLCLLKKDTP